MNVLLCHNHYQHAGGEDAVFADEAWLLESRGHRVVRITRHNDDVRSTNSPALAAATLFNRGVYREVRDAIRRERVDVVHCTNVFPLLSPAVYYAARRQGVPVVQSLHNYRYFCANGLALRDGRPCEKCLHRRAAWPAVVYGCYRDSRAASAAVVAMQTTHRAAGVWRRAIEQFITPTEFARDKLVAAGLPEKRIAVKPNFVRRDAPPGDGAGGFAIFVGRLAPEKGVDLLLDAWRRDDRLPPLKIVGDGPRDDRVRRAAATDERIEWLGRRDVDEVATLLGDAALLVVPSICFETFGRVVAEAFAAATPAVVSRGSAPAELVAHGRTGMHFDAGSPTDLAATVGRLMRHPDELAAMRRAARTEYERRFTAEANYRQLMAIYQRLMTAPDPCLSTQATVS